MTEVWIGDWFFYRLTFSSEKCFYQLFSPYRLSSQHKKQKFVKPELSLLNCWKEEDILISLIFASDFEKRTRRMLELRRISIKYTGKIFFLILEHFTVFWLGWFIVIKFLSSMLWEAFCFTEVKYSLILIRRIRQFSLCRDQKGRSPWRGCT